eukprot:814048-Pelagomonas_calceolata.AAC.1
MSLTIGHCPDSNPSHVCAPAQAEPAIHMSSWIKARLRGVNFKSRPLEFSSYKKTTIRYILQHSEQLVGQFLSQFKNVDIRLPTDRQKNHRLIETD